MDSVMKGLMGGNAPQNFGARSLEPPLFANNEFFINVAI